MICRPPLRIVAIVQARMGATRLFGKPLKTVLNKPLLQYLIERLKEAKLLDEIVIATTDKELDNPIANLAATLGVSLYRGSEENVLDRYLKAAEHARADIIVRITGDCPLMDPKLADAAIQFYLDQDPLVDYASNVLKRTFPRGMDIEIFSMDALKKTAKEAQEIPEREHVTLFIYRHPELFKLANFAAKEDNSQYRWTVDTPEDFELISKLIEMIYPKNQNFSLEDLLAVIKKHPQLSLINAHVEQKRI